MRKITAAAGMAALAALTLAGCASPIGEAFEEAPPATVAEPALVTTPSATPTAAAVESRFVLEIDGQRDFSAPALGTATVDLSDGTLAFTDVAGLPIGAPMPVAVDAEVITSASADVTAILSDANGNIIGFNAIYLDGYDELKFVNVRASDDAPVRSPEDFKGDVALKGHVAPAAWDVESAAVWAFGSVTRGDLALNITE
ncbi:MULTISPECIES: hypothetical protein [unclassified Pseudoclavibacter]|uniref:hypothetical protein n=1 Tax=unclassified Pseudoclavibacter TaxID=2615177 RepID=UPI001BAB6EEA|nr:hypothetical protein [Pseudoclavibacter sp. Marseille-Q4354]MBS3180032.1 hypothetical protein [Pseudoclavibacter sp. Marseille-Q4354]